MTTSHRRIALLTGASLAVLGTASPALAAPHDGLPDGVYSGANTTDPTIVICDLDETETPTDPCFFGVIDGVSVPQAVATAAVSSPADGDIWQRNAGAGSWSMVNATGDSAEIGAIAHAANAAGGATA